MKGCAKYPIGALREIVAIQAKTRTADGMGGFTVSWATVAGAPTRAMITAAPGSERWGFMRQTPGNTYKMVTRHFAAATAAQRVTWKGKEYGVLGVVDPDGREDWLEWRLSDGVAS
jgi:SPP1 family predicted phage head-tail adaptor